MDLRVRPRCTGRAIRPLTVERVRIDMTLEARPVLIANKTTFLTNFLALLEISHEVRLASGKRRSDYGRTFFLPPDGELGKHKAL